MANPWDNDPVIDDARPLPNGGVFIPPTLSPKEQAEEQRAQAQEARAAADAAGTGAPPAGYRWNADRTALEPIPGGPAVVAEKEATGRLSKLQTLMEQIDRVEELYKQNVKGGFPGAVSGRVPGFIRPENPQFAAAGAGMAEQALSAFRVPGAGAQSDRELIQFVEANKPLPTDEDLAIEEKLRQLRARAQSEIEALGGAKTPPGPSALDPTRQDSTTTPAITGKTEGQPYKTGSDIELEGKLNSAFKAGASLGDLQAIASEYNADLPFQSQEELDAARKAGRSFNVLPSGVAGAAEGVAGSLGDTGFGAYAIGAANALLSGGFDEIAKQIGLDPKLAQAAKEELRNKYPVSSIAGEISGAALQLAGARGLGVLGAGTKGLAAGEIAQGAAYGFGESNENRLAGAALGAGAAVVGQQLGKRLIEPGVQAIIGRMAKQSGVPKEAVEEAVTDAIQTAEAKAGQAAPMPGGQAASEVPLDADQIANAGELSAEVEKLARDAASWGPRATAAKKKLATMMGQDPEVMAAAQRLGVDIPPDVASDSVQMQNLIGLARSQSGSQAEAAWQKTVGEAAGRVEELMTQIGASRDMAQLSDNVFSNLDAAQKDLRRQAEALRVEVNRLVRPEELAEGNALKAALEARIAAVGGAENLDGVERRLLKAFGEGLDKQPTYGFLEDLRQTMGQALEKRSGPWVDANEAELRKYYAALAQDRVDHVARVAGPEAAEKLKASNAIFSQMYDTRQQLVDLFGKDLDKGIAGTLQRAITGGSKGDVAGLRRMMKLIPEDMRREAVMSAILTNSLSKTGAEGGFSFANFAKMWRGVKDNSPVWREIGKAIGPEGDRLMTDIYRVGQRIAQAETRVLKTGKALTGVAQRLNAQSLTEKMLQHSVIRASAVGASALGGSAMGGEMAALGAMGATGAIAALSGGMRRTDKLHDVMTSKPFLDLVEKAADGTAQPADINRLAGDGAFAKWARDNLGLTTPQARQNWINSALTTQAVGAAQPEPAPQIEVR